MLGKMVLSLGVVAALIAALVIFVEHTTNDTPSEAQVSNPKAVAEENREAEIVVGQDQRPHVAKLVAGAKPGTALKDEVTDYIHRQLSKGLINGTLMHSECSRTGGTASRQLWRCSVDVANVRYPFDGVVEPAARRIIYCKRDPPPVPTMNIPVSPRCT